MFESLRVVTLCPHAFRLARLLLNCCRRHQLGTVGNFPQANPNMFCEALPLETIWNSNLGQYSFGWQLPATDLPPCPWAFTIRTSPGAVRIFWAFEPQAGNLLCAKVINKQEPSRTPRKIWLILIAFTCYNVVSEACDQHHCLSVAFVNGSQSQFPLDFFAGQCCFPEDSSISLQQIQVPRLKKVSPPFI